MQNVFILTGIVAVTELYKRLTKKDWEGVVTILAGVGVGVVAGLLGLVTGGAVGGALAGLAAVGIHTVARQVG